MPVTATLDRLERIGLHELLRNHLRSLGDLWLALERERDYEKARRMAREFSLDFALLNEIGWDPAWDPMAEREIERFELRMPAADLRELVDRLCLEAEQLLKGSPSERRARQGDGETDERVQYGFLACEELAGALRERER